MNGREFQPGDGETPGMPEAEGGAEPPRRARAQRTERKRRKVSLIAAIVINVVTLITLTVILLAVLLPGYRRSFTVARAVEGSQEVWIVVRTSEAMMRHNSTDFIRAQDGLESALQEEVGANGEVWAYVRDNYPDKAWVEDNLPQGMREWLEGLYPKPTVTLEDPPWKMLENEEEKPASEVDEDGAGT